MFKYYTPKPQPRPTVLAQEALAGVHAGGGVGAVCNRAQFLLNVLPERDVRPCSAGTHQRRVPGFCHATWWPRAHTQSDCAAASWWAMVQSRRKEGGHSQSLPLMLTLPRNCAFVTCHRRTRLSLCSMRSPEMQRSAAPGMHTVSPSLPRSETVLPQGSPRSPDLHCIH